MLGKNKSSLLPACGFIICLLFILVSADTSFAQEYSNLDSLKTGVKYKLILFDDTEVIGRIVSNDSEYVKIETGKGVLQIRKDDIFTISKNLTPSKYKFMFSLCGGLAYPTEEFFGGRDTWFKHSFAIQLSGGYLFKPCKVIRLNLEYSRLKAIPPGWGIDIQSEGGDADMYSLRADVLVGELRPKYNIIAYAFVGLGIQYSFVSARTTKEYWNSTYHTFYYEAQKDFNAVFCLGGGVGYRITPVIGVYSEINLAVTTNKYSNIEGYIPVKFGLAYFIF
jgi:hypothetical protein